MSIGGKSGSGAVTAADFPSETTSLANPITYYKQIAGVYPSNAEIWWSMNRPPELGVTAPPKLYLEVFDPGLRYQITSGGAPAPKGHFILNAFHQDRGSASGISNLEVQSSGSVRPRAIAFFSGRVFYAGVNSIGFSANVYFSPVIERHQQVGDCFQIYDPTSEDIRDLLPSDGGVIVIPEVSIVHHMASYGASLLIFADNGVWRVSGSEGVGFRANDYSVTKVSGVPTISNLSFIDVEGVPVWWNRSSINAIALGPDGSMTVRSLTDDTIKRLYEEIPEQSKFHAKGAYDPLTKTVQYLYRSTTTDDPVEKYQYDRILSFDSRTNAFMPWSLTDNERVDMLGIFSIAGQAVSQSLVGVIVGTDNVLSGTDEVISVLTTRSVVQSKIKYIVNVKSDVGLADEPPDEVIPPETFEVIVNTDNVIANTDNVQVTL